MNVKDQKFDEFMINGFIGVMVIFMIIVVLCIVFRKYCTHPLIGGNKDMEELDREAYDDLKKEYMERRRAKIAE
jgi:signal transduction histidine kinase